VGVAIFSCYIFEKQWNVAAYDGFTMRTNHLRIFTSAGRLNFQSIFCADYLRKISCKEEAPTKERF
jgi:hypothetical protein